jgi:hypothetical protein
MLSMERGDRALALGLLGLAFLALGIWQFFPKVVGTHISECGFDAHGAYAEIQVNNLLGAAHNQEVWVDFSVNGTAYPYGGAYFRVPAHGHGKTVVRPGLRTMLDGTHQGHVQPVSSAFAQAHTLSCRFDFTDPD